MRRSVVLGGGVLCALAMLSACKREPTFDERYAGARKAIQEQAGELDKDMAQRAAAARQAAPQPAPDASGEAASDGKI